MSDDRFVDDVVGLSGSDFTRLQLEIAQRRAARRRPADLMAQHGRDAFVRPGAVDQRALSWVDAQVFAAVPDAFEAVELSPVVPLGTVSVVAKASQHKVCSAQRNLEVVRNPTNAMALIAVQRRRSGDDRVRLCTSHRTLRMQRVGGSHSWQHFRMFAAVTAGRDRGGRAFEREALAEHLALQLGILDQLRRAGVPLGPTRVRLQLDPAHASWVEVDADAREALPVDGYYRWVRFVVDAEHDGTWMNLADGGFVDWAAALGASRKERLFISAVGTERLAALWAAR